MPEHQDSSIEIIQSGNDSAKAIIQRGTWVFKWSLILTASFVLIIVVGLAVSISYSNVEKIDRFMVYSRPWLGYWRLFLFLIVFAGWTQWSAMYANWSLMNAEQLERMIVYRWRMAMWLLVMEALFSQKLLGYFVNQILQAGV